VLFLSITHLSNNKQTLDDFIDFKYKYKLRTCDNTELQLTKSKSKSGSMYRRMTLPKIDVQKTSTFEIREEPLRAQKTSHDNVLSGQGEAKNMDFIQFSNSVNVEMLSPDVKQFLRRNRIRVRGEQDKNSQKSDNSQKRKGV